MFTRSTIRSFRFVSSQISRRALSSSSSSSASSSNFNRNAVIGITTLAVAGLSITSERRKVLNDDKVRESVLDQPSLKKPIHKREDTKPTNTEKLQQTTEALQDKATEIKDQVVDKTKQVREETLTKAQEVKDQVVDKTKQTREEALTKGQELKDQAVDKTKQTREEVRTKAQDVKEQATDNANKASSSISSAASEASHVVEEKSAEAAQPSQGAFNEETGEINWDCPCLGGMADGPCGEQFKEAFSCFIYSEAEPKGVDCVEKFKHMQDCFRAHPEIYGEEIDDDEDETTPSLGDESVSVNEEKQTKA
ncbi:uncharacterized protein L201_005697 [Kwoniella dendrophila CBS 6074]|uniref:Mitochondrial intermembrane space import and assembly protein 40 n=1 Tax=Kwoniella dendrophila CBS 6074 TaxID=1295534 RepID=A0AAX4JZE2_9TREE